MDSLEKLITAIAKTIEKRRRSVIGCLSVRPGYINRNKSPIYSTAIAYVLDLLTQEGLVQKERSKRGIRYLICRDSILYNMNTEELKSTIREIVERHEKRRDTK